MRIVTAGHVVKTRVAPGLSVVHQPLYSKEMPRISASWPTYSCRRRLRLRDGVREPGSPANYHDPIAQEFS
jgi:hypothetical protein